MRHATGVEFANCWLELSMTVDSALRQNDAEYLDLNYTVISVISTVDLATTDA